jgi:hypothetical protein
MVGVTIRASNDRVNYVDLYTITAQPTLPGFLVSYEISTTTPYRYLEVYKIGGEYSTRGCQWAEIEFFGSAVTHYLDASDQVVSITSCPVKVSVPTAAFDLPGVGANDRNGQWVPDATVATTAASTYAYSDALTPTVTSIAPATGTTGGGTLVTVTVTNGFTDATSTADVTVTLDKVACVVQSVSATQVSCLTGARPTFVPPSMEVTIAGKGMAATMGHTWLYTDRWSAITTWGGNPPPRKGESVVIPFGQHVLLDVSPPLLQIIIVEGTLMFEDEQDIKLEAYYIMLRNGTLTVGTEKNPFTHQANITLHGENSIWYYSTNTYSTYQYITYEVAYAKPPYTPQVPNKVSQPCKT